MKLKHPEIPIPENMKSLPMTDRGYLKPWFVKADDFRVVDNAKAEIANAKKACWICGKPFNERRFALVCSPLSAMTRIFREPPCHIECAEYAMRVCPFILYPNSKRRTANLEKEASLDYINRNLKIKQAEENPGEYYLVSVKDFYLDKETLTIRCNKKDIVERQHWIEGVKQSGHPIPIVKYQDLPPEMKSQFTEDQFKNQFEREKQAANAETPGKFEPVTFDKHRNQYWTKRENYLFARSDCVVSIGARELTSAMNSLPTGFVKLNDGFRLVAIVGLQPGRNGLVSQDGKWRTNHVPAVYECFPFKLLLSNDSERLLCVNSSSILSDKNLATDNYSKFFVNDKSISPQLEEIKTKLASIAQDESAAVGLTEQLENHDLIRPWSISVKYNESVEDHSVSGIYCVDESGLGDLSPESLKELHDTGALLFAYCQLLSMKHLKSLFTDSIESIQ